MMIHISRDEAQTLLNAVQAQMSTAHEELSDCYVDADIYFHCETFIRAHDLEQKIMRWLDSDQKE